jgi:chemotaxis signal transduction protein
VEEVIGMIDVQREECRPLPPQFRQDERTWVSGTTFFQERLVLILSPEWILGELGEVVGTVAGPGALSQS